LVNRLGETLSAPLTSSVLSFLDTKSHIRVARCSKELCMRAGDAASWPAHVELFAKWFTKFEHPLPLLQAAASRVRELSLLVRHAEDHNDTLATLNTAFLAGFSALQTLRMRNFHKIAGPAVKLSGVRHLMVHSVPGLELLLRAERVARVRRLAAVDT
jgi:hypothetical protein